MDPTSGDRRAASLCVAWCRADQESWAVSGVKKLGSLYDRVLDKLSRSSPGAVGGAIDLLRPTLAQGLGGPFNGQERRVEAVRDIFDSVQFRAVIETGTYRATTTLFLRALSGAPIVSIEADSRYYHYSRIRLRRRHVRLIRGDSAKVLRSLANEPPWNRSPAFFYLDAHWLEALPLPSELESIASGWSDFAALIDDFRVPDDPGYGYDNYGPGRSLESSMLGPLAGKHVVVYWPSAPSGDETGARRGWVVLASAGGVDDSLRSLGTLRRAGPVESVAGIGATTSR